MKRFWCNYIPDKRLKPWYIDVSPAKPFDTEEYEVCAKGSTFIIIVSHYSQGIYMCIPNWSVGMEIVDADDYYWNYEKLSEKYPLIKKIDRISIVNALNAIKYYNN